jgi:sterol desaturase/sphingolipid hydroxylase (fatty acid hydroxylase superfamily)
MHKVPLLWRLHRVHHTDTFVDVSTTVRFHPGEYLVSTPIIVGSVFLMGISPIALMIYEVFDAAMAVFTHANIRMPKPVDRFLRLLLVTPDMHRVHHSSHQPETDSNYGATLSIWDRLFGTYTEKEPEELATMQLGLKECQDKRSTSLWWQLRLPFTPSKIEKTEMNHKSSTETNIS